MNEKRKEVEEFIENWIMARNAGGMRSTAVLSAVLLNISDQMRELNKTLNQINQILIKKGGFD